MEESKDDSDLETTLHLQSGAKVSWEAAGPVQLPAHAMNAASLIEHGAISLNWDLLNFHKCAEVL